MSTTIKDIANAVNISTAAVSLVLNNKPCRISEEKKELIRRTAQEMDYQPNRNAVALVTSRTMIIGTIVYDVSNAYFAEFAKGVEDTAADFEYQILLVNINNRKNKAKNYAKILGYNSTDALIVASNLDDPELEKYVNSYYNSKKPVANAGNGKCQFPSGNIIFRNEKGGYLATKHLLELGHRKIGCITGPNNTPVVRLEGYKAALEEYGVPYDNALVKCGDYHGETASILARELYEQGVTAIFTFNDLMAYGVYRMAKEMKIRIPADLSVVGFDDLEYSSLMSVPLTTIHQPAYAMGVECCKMAIRMIQYNTLYADNIYFEPELIVRKSTKKYEG